MNGRIYDPVLGRFLQADPVVQAPDNSQNLNRYTYVLNNPLSYTDPSGFFFKSIGNFIGKFWQPILAIGITVVSAGVATGALFASLEIAGTSAAWGVAIGGGALAGLVNAGNLRGALYGAFSAAAFHGVGTYFSNIRGAAAKNLGRFGNFVKDNLRLTKTIAHGLTGGIMNELQGGKFAHGFLSAGATQALAPSIESIGIGDGALSFGDRALRVASAAALGGAVSEVTGGKFANGAVTGAFSRAFNDELDDFLEEVESLEKQVNTVQSAFELREEDFLTLFPSYAGAVDALGLDIAKVKLLTDFREELLSGALMDSAQQGAAAVREHARGRVTGSLGIAGNSLKVIGRALDLTETQVNLITHLHIVVSGLSGNKATVENLSRVAEEIRQNRMLIKDDD